MGRRAPLQEVRRLIREAAEILGVSSPRVSLSARKLELYSMPGDEAAAREISDALTKAAREILSKIEKIKGFSERTLGPVLASAWKKHVAPAMKKHSKFGATDSEPWNNAAQALIDLIKDHYGEHGYTSLGDYV